MLFVRLVRRIVTIMTCIVIVLVLMKLYHNLQGKPPCHLLCGESSSNLPLLPIKHCIPVICHTSPSFYSIINPPGPHVHLQVTHSQFHSITFHLVLVLFVSQLPKYGIPYRLTFCSLKHSSFRRHLKTRYFHSTYPAP